LSPFTLNYSGDFWKHCLFFDTISGDFWKHLEIFGNKMEIFGNICFLASQKIAQIVFKSGIDMHWRFFCFQVGDFWKHLENCPKLGISNFWVKFFLS